MKFSKVNKFHGSYVCCIQENFEYLMNFMISFPSPPARMHGSLLICCCCPNDRRSSKVVIFND